MTKQKEIKFLLQTFGIKQSWLAEKLGLKKQTLTYLLNEDSVLDDILYQQIKDIIKDYQLEFDFFYKSLTDDLDLFSEDNLPSGIGTRIRLFAKRKYKTLKALADALEISPQQLQQYTSGRREPGTKIMIKLLKAGCDINWLLGGAGTQEPYRTYQIESELKKLKDSVNQIKSILEHIESHY